MGICLRGAHSTNLLLRAAGTRVRYLFAFGLMAILLAALAGPAPVRADSLTLQNNGTDSMPSRDTWIYGSSNYDDYNYGADYDLRVRRDDNAADRVSLIGFNISSLPQNIVITRVRLGLLDYKDDYRYSSDWLDIGVYKVNDTWTEGTGDHGGKHGSQRDGAAWYLRNPYPSTDQWYNGGAHGASRATDPDAIVYCPHVGDGYAWRIWDSANSNPGLITTVTDWYNNPSHNNGWALDWTSSSDVNDGCYFHSGNYGDPNYTPYLTIDYTVAPEPATLGLLGAGLLGLLARRRGR